VDTYGMAGKEPALAEYSLLTDTKSLRMQHTRFWLHATHAAEVLKIMQSYAQVRVTYAKVVSTPNSTISSYPGTAIIIRFGISTKSTFGQHGAVHELDIGSLKVQLAYTNDE
jgi:hypothetical protein